MSFSKSVLATTLFALAGAASATPLSASYIRSLNTTGNFFGGVAVDQKTGVVYQTTGYAPYYGDKLIHKYADVAAFEAGTEAGTIANPALWGTYLAANNGSIYARGSDANTVNGYPSDAKAVMVSAATGAVTATTAVVGMGGANGGDTFNWGGFSGVNAMYSGNNLFYAGGAADSNKWMIARYDSALNALGSVQFSLPAYGLGWGFAIGDYVFFGDSYESKHIGTRVNGLTGEVSTVDFDIAGMNGSYSYLNNVSYDASHDALYLNNFGSLYKVANISQSLGVSVPAEADVPEPLGIALFGLGLTAMLFARRKQH